jgi:stress-induced morphogen
MYRPSGNPDRHPCANQRLEEYRVKEIVIDISDDGEVKIETRGFTGKSCIKESQFLKDLLGKEIAQQLTPAYYVTGNQKEKVKKHLPLCG